MAERVASLVAEWAAAPQSGRDSALAGVEDGMEQLINYPYGCLEQTASRLLPLIATAVLGKRFSLKLPGNPKGGSTRS